MEGGRNESSRENLSALHARLLWGNSTRQCLQEQKKEPRLNMLYGKRKKGQEKEGREGGNGCLKASVGPVGQRPRRGARPVRHLAEGRASQSLGREAGEQQSQPRAGCSPRTSPSLLELLQRVWKRLPSRSTSSASPRFHSSWCAPPPRPAGPAILAWGGQEDAPQMPEPLPARPRDRALAELLGAGSGQVGLPPSRHPARTASGLLCRPVLSHFTRLIPPVQTAGRSPDPSPSSVAAEPWLHGAGPASGGGGPPPHTASAHLVLGPPLAHSCPALALPQSTGCRITLLAYSGPVDCDTASITRASNPETAAACPPSCPFCFPPPE